MQGLLECLDVPYVGPGVLAAAVTIDKLIFKRLLRERGIAQVDFCEAGEDGLARAGRGDGPARLGEALAPRLERRHRQGRASRAGSTPRSRRPAATTPG